MRNPPILVAVIGFFAALAGFGYLFFGLRVLGFDWFGLFGDLPRSSRSACGVGSRSSSGSPGSSSPSASGRSSRGRALRP